jgi:hypothetical protein
MHLENEIIKGCFKNYGMIDVLSNANKYNAEGINYIVYVLVFPGFGVMNIFSEDNTSCSFLALDISFRTQKGRFYAYFLDLVLS